MKSTIEVAGLRKRFGRVQALDGMTFTVSSGQVTEFVGPNGAGKSTTMRVILGLDAADAGTALIGGKPYGSLRQPLSHVGSLLDAGALQPSRTARNHLLWLAHSQGFSAAAMMVTGSHGVRMQWDYTADTAGLGGTVMTAAPRWLRLARHGDTITGYDSGDGTRWTKVATVTLNGMPANAQAGLFATSPGHGITFSHTAIGQSGAFIPTQETGAFDHLSLGGTWPGGAWSGVDVGDTNGPTGLDGFRITPAAAIAIEQSLPAYQQVTAAYTPMNGYYPLAPWAGFGVLCAWTVAFLALAAFLLYRRDA